MCHKLACMITDFLLCKNTIKKEDAEIYQYGYDLLIYTVLQILLLCILGTLFGQKFSTIVYIVVFVSLRQYVGGYHASTRLGCTMVTVISYLVVMGLIIIENTWYESLFFWVLAIAFCAWVIIRYAPVENGNKPLSGRQVKQNRKSGCMLFIMYMVIALLVRLLSRRISNSIIFTVMAVAVLMIIQKKKGGKTHDEASC